MKKIKGVRKRSENTYQFTVSVGATSSKGYGRRYKTYEVTQKMTPKQLEEHLRHEYLKFKQEVLSGEYITPEKMTFSAFSDIWNDKFASKELSETTHAGHLTRLKNHIIPEIGHLSMDSIKSLTLVELLDNLKRKDGKEGSLSIHAKEDVYKTLKSIFKYAVQWRIIKAELDPMKGVNKPKSNNTENKIVNVYEPHEVTEILKAVQNEPPHWRVFLTLAIVAGVRRGENLGLEWSKVDFENNRLDITQTIVRGKSGPLIKSPKSQSSKRLIALPQSVMEELKRYRIHWIEEKLKMREAWIEDEREWLFCNEDGTHFFPTTPTTWWKRFTERNEIRYIRLHDLRHTSATLLIAQGVHAKIIAERLGHSNIKITMDTYGHALRSADQAAADTFENLFEPKKNIK